MMYWKIVFLLILHPQDDVYLRRLGTAPGVSIIIGDLPGVYIIKTGIVSGSSDLHVSSITSGAYVGVNGEVNLAHLFLLAAMAAGARTEEIREATNNAVPTFSM